MEFTKNLEKALEYYKTSGAFLTTKSEMGTNCMTVSWGFIGYMWGKPHAIVVVRPTRYTYQIIKDADSFTLSIPYGTMKNELSICGTKSGSEIDKSTIVTYVDSKSVSSPVVDGCNMFYECRITYSDPLKEQNLKDNTITKFYENDYHHMYFGEIVECYER